MFCSQHCMRCPSLLLIFLDVRAAVSQSAGTVAAFYYKNIREYDIPTKDFVAAHGQELKMTVEQFDRQVYAYALGMLEAWDLKKGHKVAVWCINELESVVAQYAAALIGIEVIVIDPSLGFEAVKQLINAESIRGLIMSPRYGGEDRHTALETEFAPELEFTHWHAGYAPFTSKRFRSLKFIACTSKEFVDGVMRFNELPVYGAREYPASLTPPLHSVRGCTRGRLEPRDTMSSTLLAMATGCGWHTQSRRSLHQPLTPPFPPCRRLVCH